jgi:hypothetical protein
MKKILAVIVLSFLIAVPVWAETFVNGGFENGDWSGWTTGSGRWYGTPAYPVAPSYYLPGGGGFDNNVVFNQKSAVVGVGTDAITGLSTVYNGSYAARVNNYDWDSHVSVISQTVTNYTDAKIYFAWAAVLEESHGPTDSDYFALTLRDETDGVDLYSRVYSSGNQQQAGYFNTTNWNWSTWYYTQWITEELDVSNLQGHTFTLSLLASDCPYTGHGGYVYLDGFGGKPPVQSTPEPLTMLLLGLGLAGLATLRRKF